MVNKTELKMKKLFVIAFFILSIGFISCSDKEKDEAELKRIKTETDSKSQTQKDGYTKKQNIKTEKETGVERADASFETKVQQGTIIPIAMSTDEESFKFSGSKIMAITLPDGKLYQVEKDGDKTIIDIPGKGKMEAIRLDKKIYLFDNDNQGYEVKFENKKLFAEKSDMTKILLSRK